MRKFILIFIGVCAVFIVLTTVAVVGLFAIAGKGEPALTGDVVLELRIDQPLVEVAHDDPFSAFGATPALSVRDAVDALEKAGDDPRVKGLLAHIATSPGSFAATQELTDAVKAFRAKGKKTVAWADSYGEFSGGNGAYFLASAFDEVYLQPSGDVGFIGIAVETPFAREALEKLGVKPEMNARHEYKNAVNLFTETTFTPAHKEATEQLARSLFNQLVRGVAEGRKLTLDEVRKRVDQGPHLADEALQARLVDGLLYRDEVYERVKETWGKGAELLWLHRYLDRAGRPHTEGRDTVALIYGVGQVMRGKSQQSALGGEATLGGDTVAAAFRRAAEDTNVKAIVFRVDSPGGSYVASDTVRREVQRAREKGKPVIVSMGNLAASGGYFVAMDADKIVAQPGTITGSIGVYAGKFVTSELWAKLGVNWETVAEGKNATLFSTDHPLTPEHRARIDAELDRIYDDFTQKAARGRNLPLEALQKVAKGRVWTGEDALALGLVDELGGMKRALELAKEAAKIPADRKVQVKLYPSPKKGLEALLAAFGGERDGDNSEDEGARAQVGLGSLRADLQAVQRALRALGLGRDAGVLTAPVPEVRGF
jgi:protease-4